YLCAEHWASKPDATPPDWAKLVQETWWREAILLYASKTSDASSVVNAALQNKSAESLTLAFSLYREKINIEPKVRCALDKTVAEALCSKDPLAFRPAAEAWLAQQQADNYTRLQRTSELSGWVTQAEYQLFLLSDREEDYCPLHWAKQWFDGEPRAPIAGISAEAAQAYCRWLDKIFPGFEHRIPKVRELDQEYGSIRNGLASWSE